MLTLESKMPPFRQSTIVTVVIVVVEVEVVVVSGVVVAVVNVVLAVCVTHIVLLGQYAISFSSFSVLSSTKERSCAHSTGSLGRV